MKIALDLDGVLAHLVPVIIEETEYTEDHFDVFSEWDDPDRFMREAQRVWADHWEDIQPVEQDLHRKTNALSKIGQVDIVTNTAGLRQHTTRWLDRHGVVYNDYVHAHGNGDEKWELDYDVYIDDNPGMATKVPVQFIPTRRLNDHLRGGSGYLYYSYEDCYVESEGPMKVDPIESSAPWVIRITSIDDVVTCLSPVKERHTDASIS